jgi:predicted unusual protein kinase regulating ubiquinone biosynthesis (AarF/ABC1/UbiB family)
VYILLALLLAFVALSLLNPMTRRVWAFHLYAAKQLVIALAAAVGLRRLWRWARGRPREPFTAPGALRHMCEDMGPTFIKFGQIVASSAGMFPERYTAEFQNCLDRVRPFRFHQVTEILDRELGHARAARLRDIDPTPLASASIAQVHTARLDDGTDVVIKVQRPGISARVVADMRVLHLVARAGARFIRDAQVANPVGIVEDFEATLAEELDFRREAANLDRFNSIMRELGHADVRAPVPNWELTTARVLVMERFFGHRVDRPSDAVVGAPDSEARLI